MTEEEIHERALLVCVLLFEEAKRVLAEASFGVNQAEIERNLRDKFGLNLSSEKISKILSDGIEKGFYENRNEIFFLTNAGRAEAKNKRTKEVMRLVLLGKYTM
jgi:hypothetical protein